jgi:hypothetical protein
VDPLGLFVGRLNSPSIFDPAFCGNPPTPKPPLPIFLFAPTGDQPPEALPIGGFKKFCMGLLVACNVLSGDPEELPEIRRVEPRAIEMAQKEKEGRLGKK